MENRKNMEGNIVKNILILAEAMVSGVKKSVLELLTGIQGCEGYNVHVGIPKCRSKLYGDSSLNETAELIESMGYRVKQFHLVKDGGIKNFYRSCHEIKKYVEDHNIELIDSHNYYAGIVGRLVAFRCGICSSHTPHLFNFHKAEGITKSRYYLQELIYAKFLTSNIVAVSPSERHEMKGFYRCEQMTVICNSVTVQEPPEKVRCEKTKLTVGTLGRIDQEKRIDDIAKAAGMCADVDFLIAGDGGKLQEYKRKYRHIENLKFLGFVKDPKNNFFPDIDIYLHPSLYEGLSYSILEAMERGKAIITTDAPGNRDLVRDHYNGYQVPIKSPDCIARAVGRYQKEPNLIIEHGRKSFELCLSKFSSPLRGAKVVDLWGSVLGGEQYV